MSTVQELIDGYEALSSTEKVRLKAKLDLPIPVPLPPPSSSIVDPLQRLLVGVSVLGKSPDRDAASEFKSVFTGVSTGVAAIESTATALAKWWATAIGASGALAGIWTAWKTSAANFWSPATDVGVRAAAIGAIALVFGTMVLAIAIILSADLRSRSVASAAQYGARAAIADAYMRSADDRPKPSLVGIAVYGAVKAAAAAQGTVHLTNGNDDIVVDDCRLSDTDVQIHDKATGSWRDLPSGAVFSAN